MAMFSNFKAFTGGFAGGINEDYEIAKKEKYALDMDKAQQALKISYEDEREKNQEKLLDYKRNSDFAAFRNMMGMLNGQATDQALKPPAQSVSANPAQSNGTLPDETQVADTQDQQQAPQVQPAVQQTVQNVPQQGTQSTPQQTNLNPQQGGIPQQQGNPMQGSQQMQGAPQPVDNTVAKVIADPDAQHPNSDFIQAATIAFAKNYKSNLPGDVQALSAIAEAKDVLQQRQAKQTEIDLKKAELEAKRPIDLAQEGKNSADYAIVMQKSGIIGSTIQEPLTPAEKQESFKLVSAANGVKSAAEEGMRSFYRTISGAGKAYSGPLSGVLATTEAAWDEMTDTQRSEALQNFKTLNKEKIQQLNAQINLLRQQAGGGIRFGVKSMEMEEKGIPDPTNMGPEEVKKVGQEYINYYKSLIGTSNAIVDGGKHIHPLDRIAMANKYSDDNPTTLEDGLTPNPNWKEWGDYRDAVVNGTYQGGATQMSNRAQQQQNISGNTAGTKGVVPYTEYFKGQ